MSAGEGVGILLCIMERRDYKSRLDAGRSVAITGRKRAAVILS